MRICSLKVPTSKDEWNQMVWSAKNIWMRNRCRQSSGSAADPSRSVDVFHNQRPRIFVGTEGDSESLLATREGRNQLRKTDFERKRDTSASRGAFSWAGV